MSEVAAQNPDLPTTAVGLSHGLSAGTLLRQAREAAGLHIAALAVSLKVPVKKLEALEADRLDLLPDAVFARALASSVCRTLKVDPLPVLASLPQSAMPRLHTDAQGINTPFSTPGLNPRATVWEQLSRPVVIAALVLVLGALVLVLLPSAEPVAPLAPAKPAALTQPEALPSAVSPAPAPALTLRPAEQMAPVATASAATGPAAVAASAPTVNATPPAPVPVQQVAQTPAGPEGLVVLSARGTSWVEVTDANGAVQLRKTLMAGEKVGASGGLPLVVTVGRADATEVQVRGKPFDLAPLTKNNVARFEVR